jgi:hypothetical protein
MAYPAEEDVALFLLLFHLGHDDVRPGLPLLVSMGGDHDASGLSLPPALILCSSRLSVDGISTAGIGRRTGKDDGARRHREQRLDHRALGRAGWEAAREWMRAPWQGARAQRVTGIAMDQTTRSAVRSIRVDDQIVRSPIGIEEAGHH